MNHEKALLDLSDVARFLGISAPTAYRYVYRRGLKPFRKVGREMFFRRTDIEDWLSTVTSETKKWPLKVQKTLGKGGAS
jgi:excisionase family DNA binding protein